MKKAFICAAAALLVGGLSVNAQTVLDDFATVTNTTNPPTGSAVAGVWYDAAQNTFGTIATDASGGARITDGGFANGVYAEMDETIPADADYTVSLEILQLFDDPANSNGIRDYQVGVILNGVHRDENPGNINTSNPTLTASGATNLVLDANDNSVGDGNSVVDTIETGVFSATTGDTIFIILANTASDITFSGTWGSSFIIVDNLTLNQVPTTVSEWQLLD